MESYPVLNREEIAGVKAGIKAYETGKGEPKQTPDDKKNKIFHSSFQVDESYRKYIDGKDVGRYNISWDGKWIKYGKNLAAPRDSSIFDNPRILVRQIPSNKTYAIDASLLTDNTINGESAIIITNIKSNPYFLLAVINSKLMTIWFNIKFDKFSRGLFPRVVVNEVGKFPIPDASEDLQNKIAQPVQQLTDEMKKEIRDEALISSLNTQIDELVMDLFQLTDEEKQSVREFEV